MKKEMTKNENAVVNKANEEMVQAEKKAGKPSEKQPKQCKNEYEENNKKEREEEKEKELQDIATSKEVIDAFLMAREAAEKATAHMDGVPADGEDYDDLLLKQLNVKSAKDFLEWISLVGRKEAKKRARKAAQKSPYEDFTQLNNKKIGSLLDLVDENPQAMKILLFIMQNMDGYNSLVCSYKVLEERFGVSHATVWRHIKYLKDHGYIYAFKTGTSNAYVLSPEVGWKSYGKNVKYCKFPGTIMLSYNEQKEKEGVSKIKRKRGRLELKEEEKKDDEE